MKKYIILVVAGLSLLSCVSRTPRSPSQEQQALILSQDDFTAQSFRGAVARSLLSSELVSLAEVSTMPEQWKELVSGAERIFSPSSTGDALLRTLLLVSELEKFSGKGSFPAREIKSFYDLLSNEKVYLQSPLWKVFLTSWSDLLSELCGFRKSADFRPKFNKISVERDGGKQLIKFYLDSNLVVDPRGVSVDLVVRNGEAGYLAVSIEEVLDLNQNKTASDLLLGLQNNKKVIAEVRTKSSKPGALAAANADIAAYFKAPVYNEKQFDTATTALALVAKVDMLKFLDTLNPEVRSRVKTTYIKIEDGMLAGQIRILIAIKDAFDSMAIYRLDKQDDASQSAVLIIKTKGNRVFQFGGHTEI